MLIYILFAIGFVLLIKGADFLVDGASSIAKKNNIPELVIGLTIISFGTSLPELIVNLLASAEGKADIAIGNIFGSNIANILLILGTTALFTRIPIKKSIYFTEIPISLIATLLVGFLANANLFEESNQMRLSRQDGAILLTFFFLFMSYIYVISKYKNTSEDEVEDEDGVVSANDDEEDIEIMENWKAYLFIVGGGIGLFFGGKWVVEGAIEIARLFDMSEKFIGLTVIAIGTSLPELVTSVVAAKKGKADLAVGNVIGSNIFNLLWILGLSSVIKPLNFDLVNNSDILMIIFGSTLLFFAVIVGKKPSINKLQGVLLISIYFAYIVYLVQRG